MSALAQNRLSAALNRRHDRTDFLIYRFNFFEHSRFAISQTYARRMPICQFVMLRGINRFVIFNSVDCYMRLCQFGIIFIVTKIFIRAKRPVNMLTTYGPSYIIVVGWKCACCA